MVIFKEYFKGKKSFFLQITNISRIWATSTQKQGISYQQPFWNMIFDPIQKGAFIPADF
jgi:hypothetical protein